MEGSKRIAKNTVLLYFRMIVTMLVSLYTSRVILIELGIDDYGIFQTVGGVIGMFSFLNGALSTGTSRYLTYALGEKDQTKLSDVFTSAFVLHGIMAFLIVILCETIGLYLINSQLVLPKDRMDIIFWVFQLSVISSVFAIIQVPYTADIISHEDMDVYAYMSILDVVLRLLIVYLLSVGSTDKMLLYAGLLLVVQLITTVCYVVYCLKKYQESNLLGRPSKSYLKDMGSFSGWNLVSSSSAMLANQGVLMLLNVFFVPAVTAARAISIQVNNAVMQFVNNYRLAAIPQMVKLYAQDNTLQSSRLVLISTEISFYLIALIGFPLLINTPFVLDLWLKEVPDYCVAFVQLIIIQSFIQTIDNSLYYGLYACGKIKQNAVISPVIALLGFPICYILFKIGYSPLAMSWTYIAIYGIIAFVIKPLLLKRFANYDIRMIYKSIYKCVLILFIGGIAWTGIEFLLHNFLDGWCYFIISSVVELVLLFAAIYYFTLDKNLRNSIVTTIKNKVKK